MKVIYHPLTKLMRQDGQDTDESDIPSMISKIMKCFKNLVVSSFCLCSIFLLFILRQLPLVLLFHDSSFSGFRSVGLPEL